jgi:glycosyltransferase involved in cell wall biosynthesis
VTPAVRLPLAMTSSPAAPLVSIIIPARDRASLLCETLDSVLAQTYPHWEALVVDDGSSDQERRLMELKVLANERIRLLTRSGPTHGASVCRNQGVASSRGDLIVFLDSDDLLVANCLAGRVGLVTKRPDVGFAVFGSGTFVERPGDSPLYWNILDNGVDDLDRFIALDPPWQTAGPIWRRAALAAIGPWDTDAIGWQDWEFHIRALVSGIAYVKRSEADNYWRRDSPSSVGLESWHKDPGQHQRMELLCRVMRIVHGAGKLTDRRRRLALRIVLQLASNSTSEPRFATLAWRNRLLSMHEAPLFLAAMLDESRGIFHGRARQAAERRWPELKEPFNSRTFRFATSLSP